MSLESPRDKIIYQGIVPIAGAVLGAVLAAWYQSSQLDQSQLGDIAALIKNPSLNPQQKLQALEIYKEITDRPWAILRSTISTISLFLGTISVGIVYRLMNPR